MFEVRNQLKSKCSKYLEVCEGGKEGSADALNKDNGVAGQGGAKTSLETERNLLIIGFSKLFKPG